MQALGEDRPLSSKEAESFRADNLFSYSVSDSDTFPEGPQRPKAMTKKGISTLLRARPSTELIDNDETIFAGIES